MKPTPALIAIVALAVLSIVALIGAVILAARGVDVPPAVSATVTTVLSFLVGLALPSPLKGAK